MSKLSASIAAAAVVTALEAVATAQNPTARDEAVKSSPVAPGPLSSTPNPGPMPALASSVPAGSNSAPPPPPPPASDAASTQQGPGLTDATPVMGEAAPGAHVGSVQGSTQGPAHEQTSLPRYYSYRFSATVDVANPIWRSGRGYDLFSEKDAAWRFGVGVGYDALRLPASLTLGVEVGLLHEPSSESNLNPAFGSLRGSMSATSALLGASLRWAVAPWLAPYARLGLLATRVSMELEGLSGGAAGASGASWESHKWTEGALFGAGIMASMPPQNPVSFGLLVEGGLWVQRAVDIRLDRELPSDAILTAGARVGKLENTGPYVRVAGLLRF